MSIEDLIFKKCREYMVVYNENNKNEMLFKPKDALKVVDEIESIKGIIYGMDFWQFVNNDYVEVNSTDWSKINFNDSKASQETVAEARDLLKNGLLENEEYVSFVLADQEIEDK